MPVSIEGPAFPNHEGGIKFFANVTSDCVQSAKDLFVAAHSIEYKRTYSPDSFDLSHLGSVLPDDFCGVQRLSPPILRLHRPRGVRSPPNVAVDNSQQTDIKPEDLDILGPYRGDDDLYQFYLCGVLTVLFVLLAIAWWSSRQSEAAPPRKRQSVRQRLSISKIPRKRKPLSVDLNGTYAGSPRGTDWVHANDPNICIKLVDGIWHICCNAEILAKASAPAPDLGAVRSWAWTDSRRKPRNFVPTVRSGGDESE